MITWLSWLNEYYNKLKYTHQKQLWEVRNFFVLHKLSKFQKAKGKQLMDLPLQNIPGLGTIIAPSPGEAPVSMEQLDSSFSITVGEKAKCIEHLTEMAELLPLK